MSVELYVYIASPHSLVSSTHAKRDQRILSIVGHRRTNRTSPSSAPPKVDADAGGEAAHVVPHAPGVRHSQPSSRLNELEKEISTKTLGKKKTSFNTYRMEVQQRRFGHRPADDFIQSGAVRPPPHLGHEEQITRTQHRLQVRSLFEPRILGVVGRPHTASSTTHAFIRSRLHA